MLAAYAATVNSQDPLSALEVGDIEAPQTPSDWETVTLSAAALNHHDVWSLRGVGLREDRLPMVLGCDGVGTTSDGEAVVLHSVIASPGWDGDETLDPRRTLLSELHPGTLAERVRVPRRNLVPLPDGMSVEHAACVSTSWLTAYRMVFVQAGVRPGDTVLVQGAGGGVATAAVQLGAAAGLRVWVTSRDESKGERAVQIGADRAFASGERLPGKVDAVIETVGAATWSHSIRSLKPGGTVVIAGTTSGPEPESAELTRIFFQQMRIQGSTMGTRAELGQLLSFMADKGIEPVIDSVRPLAQARSAFQAMIDGDVFGKLVVTMR
ncbi:zinc-binding dehydrogenase [Rudaeicoccus suwonensis]|uniref:D-arabinose 1-dehydrogenase-like Zn-dependent alcohol dehydrogenase n=1 Tax=Rudaeicoccus suwonensis TaxID=657409 RepID=A0A561E1J3_9MICO|nr:zinc-binding dehydrogenase [Rudaeicoccus suwonensis]TWE09477.1 D-arabinose 1-dehydrogenase-like Zn-dependent alcohol dehydrogenase [Rudaeicoccus suwonensis]